MFALQRLFLSPELAGFVVSPVTALMSCCVHDYNCFPVSVLNVRELKSSRVAELTVLPFLFNVRVLFFFVISYLIILPSLF